MLKSDVTEKVLYATPKCAESVILIPLIPCNKTLVNLPSYDEKKLLLSISISLTGNGSGNNSCTNNSGRNFPSLALTRSISDIVANLFNSSSLMCSLDLLYGTEAMAVAAADAAVVVMMVPLLPSFDVIGSIDWSLNGVEIVVVPGSFCPRTFCINATITIDDNKYECITHRGEFKFQFKEI
ncbi:hypothetical protein BLOT_000174 [Blomia tropicalis]|nr:hypothetical protein BLOT_000174 [Blomia tropicalis]